MINSNTSQRTDEPLASEKIQVDRKVFFLDLKENQRGRFLKITEDVSGRLAEHQACLAGRDLLGAEGGLDVIAGTMPPSAFTVREVDADHHLVREDRRDGQD